MRSEKTIITEEVCRELTDFYPVVKYTDDVSMEYTYIVYLASIYSLESILMYCKFFDIKKKKDSKVIIKDCRLKREFEGFKEMWFAITPDDFKVLLEENMFIKLGWNSTKEIRKKEIRDKLKEIERSEKDLSAKKIELEKERSDL